MNGNKHLKLLSYLSIYIGGLMTFVITPTSLANTLNSLVVSPNTCIVNKLGDVCRKELTIKWKTPIKANYCLYDKHRKIKCWVNQSNISESLLVSIKGTTTLTLKDEKKQMMASTTIVVNGATSTRFRRRLRADWSVF